MTVSPRELLELAVPGYATETFLVLAAWYYNAGQLDLQAALGVAGTTKEEFLAFANNKQIETGWAARAEFLTKEHAKRGKTFTNWLSKNGEDVPYAYTYMKVWRMFGGTPIVKLPFERVRQLLKFPNRKIKTLIAKGKLLVDGKTFSLDELINMSVMDFRKLTYPYRSAPAKTVPWVEKARLLREATENDCENDSPHEKLGLSKPMAHVLLKLERSFAGLPIQKLPLRRAIALLTLDPEKIVELRNNGSTLLNDKKYTIEDFALIPAAELKNILKPKAQEFIRRRRIPSCPTKTISAM